MANGFYYGIRTEIKRLKALNRQQGQYSPELLEQWAVARGVERVSCGITGKAADRLLDILRSDYLGLPSLTVDHTWTFRGPGVTIVTLQPYGGAFDKGAEAAFKARFAHCPYRISRQDSWYYPGKSVLVEFFLEGEAPADALRAT